MASSPPTPPPKHSAAAAAARSYSDSEGSSTGIDAGRDALDDRENVFGNEDEAEELLRQHGRSGNAVDGQRGFLGRVRARRRQQQQHRYIDKPLPLPRRNDSEEAVGDEDVELMYDTETSGRRRRRRGKKDGYDDDDDDGDEKKSDGGGSVSSLLRSNSPGSSSEADHEKMRHAMAKRRPRSRFRSCLMGCCWLILLLVLFIGITYGAYQASVSTKQRQSSENHETSTSKLSSTTQTLSNGTHLFAPTTLLISLDGFRADFLSRGLSPTLSRLIKQGVSPEYMTPSFPSLTFPNHYTLVTGLHPESHGVVSNSFWDPALSEEFYYTNAAHSMQPKWWTSEPLWVTAEEQGVRCAIHMWPGSEAHLGKLTYLDKFNGSETLARKTDRVMNWLDLPSDEDVKAQQGRHGLLSSSKTEDLRPQFIALYVPNVDADGHKYGPNSTEMHTSVEAVDKMVGDILERLETRNLSDIVNVVVLSDHGMATTDASRVLQLEHLLGPEQQALLDMTDEGFGAWDGWPHYGLRPKVQKGVETDAAGLPLEEGEQQRYNATLQLLHSHLTQQTSEGNVGFDVYLRDVDMPERYHFQHNPRIAPLWIMPRTGWAIATTDEFDVDAARAAHAKGFDGAADDDERYIFHPRGIHGYDNQHPLMRAMFVARGPAFTTSNDGAGAATGGTRITPFQNTNVYNLLCDSLGVTPRQNNGTLHLPLRADGAHPPDHPDSLTEPPLDHVDDHNNNGGEHTDSPEIGIPAIGIGAPGNDGNSPDGNGNADATDAIGWIEGVGPVIPSATGAAAEALASLAASHNGTNNGPDANPNEPQGDWRSMETVKAWWDWVKNKFDNFKDWAKHVVDEKKKGGESDSGISMHSLAGPGHDDDMRTLSAAVASSSSSSVAVVR